MQTVPENSKILFTGNWEQKNVVIFNIESTRVIDEKIEQYSQNVWEQKLEIANKQGSKLWDSIVYRFELSNYTNDKLDINLSDISFSTRLGMNECTEDIRIAGELYAPRGVFTSCMIKTSDNYLIFIEKSNKFFTEKKLSFIGGILSRSESTIDSGGDLFFAVKNEVTEEIGIPDDSIISCRLRLGYLTENFNVCFVFDVNLSLTKNEVSKIFKQNSDGEALDILFIQQTDVYANKEIFDAKDKLKLELIEKYC